MKPVMQTQFYPGPDREDTGNCFAACIASLLELDLSEVPNFVAFPGDEWWERFRAFMLDRGLLPLYWSAPEESPETWTPPEVPGYSVLTGPGPAGCRHSVVGFNNEMVHDPHPRNEGIKYVDEVMVFVATDPVRAAITIGAAS